MRQDPRNPFIFYHSFFKKISYVEEMSTALNKM